MVWAIPTEGGYPDDWPEIATATKDAAGWECIRCRRKHSPATGYTLTVHHFDGNKANCEWWNLMALCQRCHLMIQARVNPDQDIFEFLEISDWMKPFVAGRRAAFAGEPHDIAAVTEHLEEYLCL